MGGSTLTLRELCINRWRAAAPSGSGWREEAHVSLMYQASAVVLDHDGGRKLMYR